MEVLLDRPPLVVGGVALGLTVVALLAAINQRLGVAGGFAEVVDGIARRTFAFGWRSSFLFGIVGGGFLFALLAGGDTLAWVHATDPDAIRRMLLLEDLYLFGVIGLSTVTAFAGIRLLRRLGAHALVTREPLAWTRTRPQRHHVLGSVIFGAGWGIANTCPGPVAAQLGQGALWSLLTIGGIAIGMQLRARQLAQPAKESPRGAAGGGSGLAGKPSRTPGSL